MLSKTLFIPGNFILLLNRVEYLIPCPEIGNVEDIEIEKMWDMSFLIISSTMAND